MASEEFNEIRKELNEDDSLLFEILSDPAAYDKSTGARVGQGAQLLATSVSQTMNTLLPEWSDARIQNAVNRLESQGLIKGVSSSYNTMRTDRGIRVLQNKLTEKGKDYTEWLASTED